MMKASALIAVALFLAMPSVVHAQAAMYEGRPTFAEGNDLGYYIWKDSNHWHVRWTTRGATRRFTGSVASDVGELKKLKRIDVESETRVLYPGRPAHVVVGPRGRVRGVAPGRAPVVVSKDQDKIEMDGDHRIVFNALTTGDIDGFDFNTEDETKELRFTMQVNGQPMPAIIQVGKDNIRPRRLPLIVTLK
jgi:hypothetical protein